MAGCEGVISIILSASWVRLWRDRVGGSQNNLEIRLQTLERKTDAYIAKIRRVFYHPALSISRAVVKASVPRRRCTLSAPALKTS